MFYFNRAIAFLVSHIFRQFLWRKYRIYFKIQALQISVLGGRIFFKGIRYHGHNETILVQSGHITWKYWLRKARVAEIFLDDPSHAKRTRKSDDTGEHANDQAPAAEGAERFVRNTGLPCRIQIRLSGVEVFFYNRSPAYDCILESILGPMGEKHDKMDPSHSQSGLQGEMSSEKKTAQSIPPPHLSETRQDLPRWLRVLPFSIDCKKGSIVIGNENTYSIVTSKFESAKGLVDVSTCGLLDIYKQSLSFTFGGVSVYLNSNPDFKRPQLAAVNPLSTSSDGKIRAYTDEQDVPAREHKNRRTKRYLYVHRKRPKHTSTQGRKSSRRGTKIVISEINGSTRWKGLKRYQNAANNNDENDWDAVDYAKVTTIAELTSLTANIYWDVPGVVPSGTASSIDRMGEEGENINGAPPPDYGVELHLKGGIINYGPWADRQRINLQQIFFPTVYTDANPAALRAPGQERVYTVFKLCADIEETIILRIPTREASKDWRWKSNSASAADRSKSDNIMSRAHGRSRRKSVWHRLRRKPTVSPTVRPMGWLDIKLSANTAVSYTMDMLATRNGYKNKLHVDCPSTTVTSSVNHGLLWHSGRLRVNCDLSNPCQWNSLRTWSFGISIDKLDLFLLRDHIFLFTDLVNDWTTGPDPEYFTFVPFQYLMNIDLRAFRFYINVNDGNIINNPSDMDDNNFLILLLPELCATVDVPLRNYKVSQNKVSFTASNKNAQLHMSAATRSTLRTYLDDTCIAKLGHIEASGVYSYFTRSSTTLTDTLSLNLQGSELVLCLFGFLIRYFNQFKDNYFGDYVHFKTIEEFKVAPSNLALNNAQSAQHEKPLSNDLEVIILISVEESILLLPTNLYTASNCIQAQIPYAFIDLRVTNYYMDIAMDYSPASFMLSKANTMEDLDVASDAAEMFLDGLTVTGHRLFGLPPSEPTYVCIWDFKVGDVTGEWSMDFSMRLARFAETFPFSLDDVENCLSLEPVAVISDVTYLKLKTGLLNISLRFEECAIQLQATTLHLDFNDFASNCISQRLKLSTSQMAFALIALDPGRTMPNRLHRIDRVQPLAHMIISLDFDLLKANANSKAEREAQQRHILKHDQRTKRTQFLILKSEDDDVARSGMPTHGVHPPAMSFPPLPFPFGEDCLMSFEEYSNDSESLISLSSSKTSTTSFVRHERKRDSSKTAQSSVPGVFAQKVLPLSQESIERFNNEVPSSRTSSNGGRTFHDLTLSSSSPLSCPSFPLSNLRLDLKDVPLPKIDNDIEFAATGDISSWIDTSLSADSDDASPRLGLLADLSKGVFLYCTQEALLLLPSIYRSLISVQTEDLIDKLQVDVTESVTVTRNSASSIGSLTDLSLNIGTIIARFDQKTKKNESENDADRYDLCTENMKIFLRNRLDIAGVPTQTVTSHFSLNKLSLAIIDHRMEGNRDEEASSIVLDNMTAWLACKEFNEINLAFNGVEAILHSLKIGFLHDTVYRLINSCRDVGLAFHGLENLAQHNSQRLINRLTAARGIIPDPPFITRPSHALRAFLGYCRGDNSWKVLSRYRYMYRSLSREEQASLLEGSSSDANEEFDPKASVLAILNEWQIFDAESDILDSLFVQRLYPKEVVKNSGTFENKKLAISLQISILQALVDPGPKQSVLSTDSVSLYFESRPYVKSIESTSTEQSVKYIATVELYIKSTTLSIDWKILNFVDDYYDLLKSKNLDDAATELVSMSESSVFSRASSYDYHVVVMIEDGNIEFSSPHLAHILRGTDLTVSIGNNELDDLNITLSANEISSSLYSISQAIWHFNLYYPVISVSGTPKVGDGTILRWQIIGSARDARIILFEEIHTIIVVANSVILHEVAYLFELYQRITPMGISKEQGADPVSNAKLPRTNVALFVASYHFQCALLHEIFFESTGGLTRIAARSSNRDSSAIKIVYGIESQNYLICKKYKERKDILAELSLPPVDGLTSVTRAGNQTQIILSSTLDKITVNAQSIYTMIGIINQPEVEEAIVAIKNDFNVVASNIQGLKSEDTSQALAKEKEDHKEVCYSISCVLSSFGIIVRVPQSDIDKSGTLFMCKLSSVRVNVTNIDTLHGISHLPPDMSINVQKVGLMLGTSAKGQSDIYGSINLDLRATSVNQLSDTTANVQNLNVRCTNATINVFAETVSALITVINHLREKTKDIDFTKERKYLRKLRRMQPSQNENGVNILDQDDDILESSFNMLNGLLTFDVQSVQFNYIVCNSESQNALRFSQDLALSFARVTLQVDRNFKGRLSVEGTQLQMVPHDQNKSLRSLNSAQLPEVIFNVSYDSTSDRKVLSFRATGRPLDVRLLSNFIVPANILQSSILEALHAFQLASAEWTKASKPRKPSHNNIAKKQKIPDWTIDANFAGATVRMAVDKNSSDSFSNESSASITQTARKRLYHMFSYDGEAPSAVLTTPGVALKVQYKGNNNQPRFDAEVCIQASTNNLSPTVVPIILDIKDSIKESFEDDGKHSATKDANLSKTIDENFVAPPADSIIEKTNFNIGIRICRQEFGLTCHPIARVAAAAAFGEVYMTFANINSKGQAGQFAITSSMSNLNASIQHVYSQESTFDLNIRTVMLSIMNTKSSTNQGHLTVIVKLDPVQVQVNAKQLQDFLLFRDIWVPEELRSDAQQSLSLENTNQQEYFIQRYRQVATSTSFLWTASLKVSKLEADVDLGQALGRLSVAMSEMWLSSRKSSIWEQNLCGAVDSLSIKCTGRLNEDIQLQKTSLQTSISWPRRNTEPQQTPLVQCLLRFGRLSLKAAFDYQAFVIADVKSFEFLMFNIRDQAHKDRLFATLDGERACAFLTTLSASQAIAFFQAFDRLLQENKMAYQQALNEVNKNSQRRTFSTPGLQLLPKDQKRGKIQSAPIALRTTIVVTLKAVSFGAFPNSFYDSQVLLVEHTNAEAHFAVAFEEGKIHSGLGVTLGQLRVSLGPVDSPNRPDNFDKVDIAEIVDKATALRSGTILRVPRVVAQMHSWQDPSSYHIDYTFKSIFEGRVDVGWNYSRISFIRNMWNNHTLALSSRLGRPVTEPAVQITGLDSPPGPEDGVAEHKKQEKIKAVVNVPQSKYEYEAIEEPIIQAPQLRDMGEATPPLEWIGLQRERLPNVTHQIVIVSLLEVAKEVEDAYVRILGSS